MSKDCKYCSGEIPIHEPLGDGTRLTVKGNNLELLDIYGEKKKLVPINYCPKCGKSLEVSIRVRDKEDIILYVTGCKVGGL